MSHRSILVAALVLLLLLTLVPGANAAPPSPGLHLIESSPDGLLLDIVVPEPSRRPLSPDRNGPERMELDGYVTGPEGLPIQEVLVGLPPVGAIEIETEPLAPVRLIQGPVPAVPVPRFADDRDRTATPTDWQWQLLDDQATKLPLASVVEEGFFRGWRIARLRVSPLAYMGDGRWELTPNFRVRVLSDGSAGAAQRSRPAAFEGLIEGMLLNGKEAVGWPAAEPPILPVTPGNLPATVWRIGITADGMYRLTYEALSGAGVPLTGTDPGDFHLRSRGQEVALQEIGMGDGHFGAGDAFLFYGEKFHGTVQEEKYTDENVYWLSVDKTAPGLRMKTRSVAPDGTSPAVEWYAETVRAETNSVWWARWSTEPGTSATWFWQKMSSNNTTGYGHKITLDAVAPDAHDALLKVEVAASTFSAVNPDHHLELKINGTWVGEGYWDGMVGWTTTVPFSSSLLQEGSNILRLVLPSDVGPQTVYSDWFEITYQRQTVTKNDRLDFSAPWDGKATYTLTGFTTKDDLRLYDLANAFAPRVLTGAVAHAAGATWNLVLTANGSEGQPYMAVADAQIQDVPALTEYHPDLGLLSSVKGADEIMIVPEAFHGAIQPLVNHRRAAGMRVEVVRTKDLYALFNDGIIHPEAIRRFLAYAYQHWQKPAPAYALLVGDGHFNPMGFNPSKYGDPTPVFIPPYLEFIDTWQGEVPVDTAFARIVGDDSFPDMAMGRLPANSAEEVAGIVAKIIAYEKQDKPAWQDRIIYAADNVPDAGGDFEGVLDRLSTDFVPSRFQQEKVYLTGFCGPPTEPPTPCPSATEALLDAWSKGAAMLTFLGHGAVFRWTQEPLLRNTDVPRLKPGHGLPFVMTLNCLDGYWIMPSNRPTSYDPTSMAEWLLLGTDHGSIANFSPAGLGTTPAEEMIARHVYNAMFYEGERGLGELALVGQLAPVGFPAHLPLVSTLFGDPGGRLKLEQVEQRFDIEPRDSTAAGVAGKQAVHSLTLTNQGELQAGAELSIVGNKWPTTPSPTKVQSLVPTQSTPVQVTVKVPSSVSPGERDTAQLIVTSTSDPSVRVSTTLVTIAMGEVQPVYLPLVLRNSGR